MEHCYFGDIHNHCNASYAHGSVADALKNARLQLDFVSVTGHSSWPDIPSGPHASQAVVDYHNQGFEKLERGWKNFVQEIRSASVPGKFIAFPSYEIHSMADGDRAVFFKDDLERMYKPGGIGEFQELVRSKLANGEEAFLLPHHIGYRQGFRGINWEHYDEKVSPVVEIISMHGCSESDEAPFPYLHTMGPRNGGGTMQAGLARGYHFGVTGSTDHHSAHPGSHGYGRVAVWAPELSLEAVWEAFKRRRCYALTGDRIELDFSVNDTAMGGIGPFSPKRHIAATVLAGDALDYVELVKNNSVVARKDFLAKMTVEPEDNLVGKLAVEVGWSERGVSLDWDVEVHVHGGDVLNLEPRFHGIDIVDPTQSHNGDFHFSNWTATEAGVRFRTRTYGNPTTTTNTNQAMCVEIRGDRTTRVTVRANGVDHTCRLFDLLSQSESWYLQGFLSGAVHLHRFVPETEYKTRVEWNDEGDGAREDFYYLRVRQRNNQWAFSTPVWVEAKEE